MCVCADASAATQAGNEKERAPSCTLHARAPAAPSPPAAAHVHASPSQRHHHQPRRKQPFPRGAPSGLCSGSRAHARSTWLARGARSKRTWGHTSHSPSFLCFFVVGLFSPLRSFSLGPRHTITQVLPSDIYVEALLPSFQQAAVERRFVPLEGPWSQKQGGRPRSGRHLDTTMDD